MQANRPNIGPWEKFYVYTTSDKEGGLSEGQQYLALKSAAFKKFVTNEERGNNVKCNRQLPGPWEKWGGWRAPIPWVVDSIDFDLKSGKTKNVPPK